jgi:hypothetical protein
VGALSEEVPAADSADLAPVLPAAAAPPVWVLEAVVAVAAGGADKRI